MSDDAPTHTDGQCSGSWTVESHPDVGPVILCYKCGASCGGTKKRIDQALHENWMGALLNVVANQGVFFLEGEVSGN